MSLTRKVMVLFEPGRYLRLKAQAHARGMSVGSLVREAVEKHLFEGGQGHVPVEEDPAMRIVGLGRSARGDLARRHDAYLAGVERRRGT